MKIGKINKLKESTAKLVYITHLFQTDGVFGGARLFHFFFIDKLLYQRTMGGVGVGVWTQIMISILVLMYSVVFLDDIVEISDLRLGFTLIYTEPMT